MSLLRFSLRQLTYFVTAAENGSVVNAARLLHVSQSSISAAIAHLEREIGVQLVLRQHGKGLHPTPEGRRVLAEAKEVLGAAARLVSERRGNSGRLRGELDLGFFTTFGPFFLPRLISSFQKLHPDVQVRFHEGDADRLYSSLMAGQIDLAISYDFGFGPGVARELLLERPPYILLPRGHRLAASKQIHMRQLATEPFVLHDLPHSRDYIGSVFQKAGIDPVVRHRTSSFELVRALVGSGEGVSLLVMRPAGDRSYDGHSLVCRPISDKAPSLRVIMASLNQAAPRALLGAFMQHTRAQFAAW